MISAVLPVLAFFSSSQRGGWLPAAYSSLCPPWALAAHCLYCSKCHLSVEIKGTWWFSNECGGWRSKVPGASCWGFLIQTVNPVGPAGVSVTSFRDLRVPACVLGWETENSCFRISWCWALESAGQILTWPITLICRLKTSDPEMDVTVPSTN